MNEEPFLSRWMRRKASARQAEAAPAEPVAAIPDAVQAPVPEAAPPKETMSPAPAVEPPPERTEARELPAIDSLKGLASDYEDFMRAGVDDKTRGAALRKLFSDPHFNQMDGLDVYIDDYGIPDPIPPAMLAGLQQARSLLWGETHAEAETDAADEPELIDSPVEIPSEPADVVEQTLSNEDVDSAEAASSDESGEGASRV